MLDYGPQLLTLPAHANVRASAGEYTLELDVADFARSELTLEIVGSRLIARGTHRADAADRPFALEEQLEETLRLPDDAALDEVSAAFRHGTLAIHVPRVPLEPRRVEIAPTTCHVDPAAEPV